MAYGARLESVLGASPRGFESPILRHRTPEPAQVPGFSLRLQRKVPIVGEGRGLKDKKSWSEPDLSALRCEKVWFKVVGGQL